MLDWQGEPRVPDWKKEFMVEARSRAGEGYSASSLMLPHTPELAIEMKVAASEANAELHKCWWCLDRMPAGATSVTRACSSGMRCSH